MDWHPTAYGAAVADIFALAENGERLMPLAEGTCCSAEALARLQGWKPENLFPAARAPRAALAGLYLYFSCRDEAHEVAQSDSSADGSYWHAIVHRQEPDAGNASYWFRRVGQHPVFAPLAERAQSVATGHPETSLDFSGTWNANAFQPGSELERAALEIQRAEWQLLFDHCARRSSD
jgi:hypothetical protein